MQIKLKQAALLQQQGKLDQAGLIYTSLLKQFPKEPAVLYGYGNNLLGKKKVEKGLKYINKAIKIAPNQPSLYFPLINHFKSHSDWSGAIESIQTLIANCGKSAPALAELASLHRLKNDNKTAIKLLTAATELDPGNYALFYNLANAYRDENINTKAVEFYQKSIQLNPNIADAHNNLGLSFEKIDQLPEAILSCQKALQLRPQHYQTLLNLAKFHYTLNQQGQAFTYAQKASQHNENNIDALLVMMQIHYELKQYDELIEVANSALSVSADNMDVKSYKASALCLSGQRDIGYPLFIELCTNREGRKVGVSGLFLHHQGQKFELAPIVDLMIEDINDDSKLEKNQLINYCFALSSYFEKQKQYRESFSYLTKANAEKRNTYSHQSVSLNGDLNSIKNTFGSNVLPHCQVDENHDFSPIFIVGMARSGTSLLEQILASHSQVKGYGELYLASNLYQKHIDTDSLLDLASFKSRLALFGKEYIQGISQSFGNHVIFVDKMPSNFLYVGAILLALPKAKIIHCHRNALENCFSIYKQNFVSDEQCGSYSMEEIAESYVFQDKLMHYWKTLFGNRIYDVKYEAMVENTEQMVRDVLAYCSLDFEHNCLEFHKTKRAVSTASTAQVRQPIYKSSIKITDQYGELLDSFRDILEQTISRY